MNSSDLAGRFARALRGLRLGQAGGQQLTLPDVCTLMFLKASAEIPLMSTVAREVGISVAAITQQADKLASLGLLARVSVPDDRRAMGLVLTERGHTCLDAAMQTIMGSEGAGEGLTA